MLNYVFKETKDKLDEVGCGFCLAKWTQLTLNLQSGHTHSCHHPTSHRVSLMEVKRNPSALHNTRFKKKQRKIMLEGGRPDECDYCWKIEDNSQSFSDRVYKSSEPWSSPYYDEIKNSHYRSNFNPTYVEVSFSDVCNFKCSYCGPAFSNKWKEEIIKHGCYKTTTNFNDIEYLKSIHMYPLPLNEDNPYVKAFWKWWDELYRNLHTFRITGGEPLLTKDCFRVLDYIINQKQPNRNLNLSINTNLGVSDEKFNLFIEKIDKIINEGKINEFILFTSVDGWGKQAEYIRYGLEFNKWWDRLHILLKKLPSITIIVMSTYNALSVPSYKTLIKNIYDLKEEYHNPYRYYGSSVMLDTSYLRWPPHQTINILEDKWGEKIKEQAQLMDFYEQVRVGLDGYGYTDMEINKMKRTYDWFNSTKNNKEKQINKKDFNVFIKEHDKRRGTDFLNVFPELEDLYVER